MKQALSYVFVGLLGVVLAAAYYTAPDSRPSQPAKPVAKATHRITLHKGGGYAPSIWNATNVNTTHGSVYFTDVDTGKRLVIYGTIAVESID